MRFLIAIVLLAVSSLAHGAAPSISCATTPNPASGTAPFFVSLDCKATTSEGVANPFRDLIYEINWGDSSSSWTTGANTAWNKNFSSGPVAGHLYTAAGTPTINVRVCNATTCSSTTIKVTVTAADTTYATTTMCVANGSLPVAGSGGCPSGATARQGKGDFDADMAAAFAAKGCGAAACARILFKGGDTFTASAETALSGKSEVTIGSYGTGRASVVGAADLTPIIDASHSTNVKIMDIAFTGNTTGAGESVLKTVTSTATTGLTIYNNTLTGTPWPVNLAYNGARDSGTAVIGNTFTAISGGGGLWIEANNAAVMGNSFTGTAEGSHGVYSGQLSSSVIQHNTFTNFGSGHDIKVRGVEWTTVELTSAYLVISNNLSIGQNYGGASISVGIGGDDANNEHVEDVIVERNFTLMSQDIQQQTGIAFYGVARGAIRNNIIAWTGSNGTAGCVIVSRRGTAPASPSPSAINIENNTCYTPAKIGGGQFIGISTDANCTTMVVNNNLVYAPAATEPDAIIHGAAITENTNSNNHDGAAPNTATDPKFDNASLTLPAHFRLDGATSPASIQSGGTASFPATTRDFYNCSQSSGVRLGAMVPRTLAQCYGVAGP